MKEMDVFIVPQQQVPVGISVEQQQIGMGGCGCGGGINPAYWGRIYGDIKTQKDLMELISSGVGGKEVQQVLTVGDTAPADPQDGDYYINTGSESLLLYVEQYEQWQNVQPSEDNIYIAIDTSHIWLWNGTQFVDVTGQKIDDVIYVSSIDDPALEAYTDAGMYTVCVSSRFSSKYYTLAITYSKGPSRIGVPPRTTYMQTLFNRDGYYTRSKVNSGDWSDWEEYLYASKADVQEAKDWAVVGWVL